MDIVIYIYNGITALDAIGPYEVLSKLPNANVKFVGETKGVIVSDNHFLKLVAEYDITEIQKADILLVPGAVIGFLRESKKSNVKEWIKKIHATTQWTLSVCSGAIILAAAGILQGRNATSHWGVIHLLKDYGANPTLKRFVREDKIITSQGVSAGIDMSLYLASQIVGEEAAKSYQLIIEYFPEPPLNFKSYNEATPQIMSMAKETMAIDVKKDLSILDLVKNLQSLIKIKKGK